VYTACIAFQGIGAVCFLPGVMPTPQDGAIRQQSRVRATLLGLRSQEFQNLDVRTSSVTKVREESNVS
jgi:hypothetical protein